MIQIKNDFSINGIHTDIFGIYAYIFNLIPSSNTFNINLKLEDILNLGGNIIRERIVGTGTSLRNEMWILFKDFNIILFTTKFNDKNLDHVTVIYNVECNYKQTPIYKLVQNNIIEQVYTKKLDFISNDGSGLGFTTFDYPDKPNNVELNYNDDFYVINDNIIKDLSQKKSGLHLLHGIPGTGKTSYIKHLINTIDKRFIYCPSFMVTSLSSPEFITLMLEYGTDSVLIIEDAENALVSRDDERNSAVTNILNLGDGLIGDVANIQIIATFNTDLSNLDEALLRKGRTLNKYEFNKLEVNKLKVLSESLNLDLDITEPLTLAEFYNSSSLSFENKKQNKIEIE
jgi:hypothetical protein